MPELPEVETVARQLHKTIKGKTISEITIKDPKIISSEIKKHLPFTVKNVTRRAKSILIHLTNNNTLLAHLRMTGHFHYLPKKAELPKYTAAIFHFTDNSSLTHNTIRRFGSIELLSKKQLQQKLAKLGPEPLDKNFTLQHFKQLTKKFPNANIKTKLLDQHFIAGIGNIYAQEAMYHAKIHPNKTFSQVSSQKLSKLYHEIRRILKLSIKNNGTTVNNYSHIDGKGDFQNLLAVYNQEYCPKKHITEKITLGGRGTYYCPRCQKW